MSEQDHQTGNRLIPSLQIIFSFFFSWSSLSAYQLGLIPSLFSWKPCDPPKNPPPPPPRRLPQRQIMTGNLIICDYIWTSAKLKGSIKRVLTSSLNAPISAYAYPDSPQWNNFWTHPWYPTGGGYSLLWSIRGGSTRKRHLFQASGIHDCMKG